MQQLFDSIFETSSAAVITPGGFILVILVSLAAGLVLTLTAMWRVESTKSFMVALAALPAAVAAVIMMVNGNLGAGVAVAGAFGLVRFRSAAGSAREIGALFAAMAVGLMTGMGFLGYAALFTVIFGVAMMAYTAMDFGGKKAVKPVKEIQITIPEDLDFNGVFEPVFEEYTESYKLVQVKTTHMGSLFKLKYEIKLKETAREKAMIDDLRVRNGNLEVMVSFRETVKTSEL